MRKFILSAFLILVVGCGNVVPPGTTVIVLKADGPPVIKHEGVYKSWGRDKVYFVDTKLKSFPKNLKILCKDDINMDVSVKWIGSFKVTDATIDVIKGKVPATKVKTGDISGYQLSLDKFFNTAMADIVSSITRQTVSSYVTDNIREQRAEITLAIKQSVLKRLKQLNYPVETADVLVTNLDYPKEVTDKRKAIKNAELQDLENAAIAKAEVAKAKRDAELAVEKGKAELVRAKADAAANGVRSKSLTPQILLVKQLEMFEKLAIGPNNTTILIPFKAMGSEGMQKMILNRQAIEKLSHYKPQTKPVGESKKVSHSKP
jgi:regulator of protease activity HflC (stomatin/prohibitin superfamily)